MDKLKILVCTHKQDDLVRTYPPYLPIHAGKALHPDVDYGYQGDDEGENISLKNREYCELTALYWGWKNLKGVEYAGLAHGHRYLDIDIDDSNVDKKMKGVDMIVAETQLLSCMVGDSLSILTSCEDSVIFMDVMMKLHPEYKQAMIDYYYKSRMLYRCNMFIAKKELYDKYCETFFPVYQEVEKRLRKHPFPRQDRAIAYMGEFSLGLFITHEKLKVKTVFCLEDGQALDTFKLKFEHWKWRVTCQIKNQIHKIANPRPKKLPVFWACVSGLRSQGIDIDYDQKQ